MLFYMPYSQLPASMDRFVVQNAAAMLFFPLLILFCLWKRRGRGEARREITMTREAPEPSGYLPVIGHLHLFWGPKPLAQILGEMADKYGPVFMLRLGMRGRMFVVANWQEAKECLFTNDKVLASRPRWAASKHLGYNHAVLGFAPYGDYWRSMHRISTAEFFSSSARAEILKRARDMEVDELMRELHGLWEKNHGRPARVEMAERMRVITNNIVDYAAVGKRYFGSGGSSDEALRFQKALGRVFQSLVDAGFVPLASDVFPSLAWMDWGGREAAVKSAGREMDAVLTGILEEHRQRRLSGKADGSLDFMDAMLDAVEDAEFSDLDQDRSIKAATLGIILGAAETFPNSLKKTFAFLLSHRKVLEKLQEELDVHVGKDRRVDESDLKKLAYLQAVVKESFRLHAPGTLSLPHEAMEDCQIGGFHVPAGAQVIVHVLKLQRDRSVWGEDAETFRPERFLPPSRHADVDVMGHHFQLIPFGCGRRGCPATVLSLQVVHLTLARLIQAFDFEAADKKSVELVFTTPNALLEVIITPRLDDTLYV